MRLSQVWARLFTEIYNIAERDLMVWCCILEVFLMIENYREKRSDCFSRRTVWVLPDAVVRVSR